MADPLLPPDPPDDPPAPAPVRRTQLTCEFCECPLAPSGEYVRLSARAKELRKLEETLDALRAELETAQTATATVTRERDELAAKVKASEKSIWR